MRGSLISVPTKSQTPEGYRLIPRVTCMLLHERMRHSPAKTVPRHIHLGHAGIGNEEGVYCGPQIRKQRIVAGFASRAPIISVRGPKQQVSNAAIEIVRAAESNKQGVVSPANESRCILAGEDAVLRDRSRETMRCLRL